MTYVVILMGTLGWTTFQVIFRRIVLHPRSGYECAYALETHYSEQERARIKASYYHGWEGGGRLGGR